MYKKSLMLVIVVSCFVGLFSQENKSALGAVTMSAIFPGSGQMYLGQNTKAGVMMAADIISLFSLYRFTRESNSLSDNFQVFAYANAGLDRGRSNEIYNLAHRWRSSEEYNKAMELWARNRFLLILNEPELYELAMYVNSIKPEDSWDWEKESHFLEYRRIRNDRQRYDIYRNFAVGALIVNRLISTIDAAIFANRLNESNSQLYTLPDFDNKGFSLIYEVRF